MDFLLASLVTVSCPNVDIVSPWNWEPGDLVWIGVMESNVDIATPIIIRIKNGDNWEIYNKVMGSEDGKIGSAAVRIKPVTQNLEYELETSRCKIRGELNSYYSPPTPDPK